MIYSKDTICVLPFTMMSNTNSGDYRVCCDSFGFGPNIQTDSADVVWNSDYYKQLRLDLVNGVKNPNCDSCWRMEKDNGYSMRKNENRNVNIDGMVAHMSDDGSYSLPPKLFDFKLGNLCNLKCIMCCQLSSSMHETEIKLWQANDIQLPSMLEWIEVEFKNEKQQYRFDKDNCDIIFKNLEPILKNLDKIRLVGGEPLINPVTFEIIDKLVERGYSKSVELEIITNLSSVEQGLIDRLEQFKSVYLTCSFDHVDSDKFHYIRFPAKFYEFKHNFETLLKNNIIKTEISVTFSIFNIFDIETIMAEFERYAHLKDKLPISFNFVADPVYFSIAYLPVELKEQIVSRVKTMLQLDYKIFKENSNVVNYLQNIDKFLFAQAEDFDAVVAERTRVLELYDTTRKTEYKKLFDFL